MNEPGSAAPVATAATDSAARRQRELVALLASVHEQPWAYDFFALLRRIDTLRPDAPRTGESLRPGAEALRLAQQPELDFAPAPLARLDQRPVGPPRLAVRFFGLAGPQGPMPLHFTEYVRDRLHQHGDAAPLHFLDLFHHRLLGLFYRAWAQTQPVVQLDRPADDRYRVWLGAAAGVPHPAATGSLPAPALTFHAGWLAGGSRHAEALVKVLGHYFGAPVAVEPYAAQWLALEPEDRSQLGYARNRPERSQVPPARLGRSANAGSRVWDRQYRFGLRLGPLTLTQYNAFIPGGSAWRPLVEWVRLLAGPELGWELRLELHDAERPPPRLGSQVRLGVTSWLGAGRAPRRTWRPLRLRPTTSFLLRRPNQAGGPTHA